MYRLITRSMLPAFLLLLTGRLSAQELHESNFVRYTTGQGLSHNMINGIAQDSTGYLWIATASGLNRYNGSQFVQFHSDNDSNSLPGEVLEKLVWIDKRRLAVCGVGLHIFDTHTGQARNLFVPYRDRQYMYKFNTVVAAAGSKAGDVFMSTWSGFYHFDKDYRLQFRYDHYPEEKVSTAHFGFGRNIFWLDDQRLMVTAISGIYIYNIQSRQFSKMLAGDWPSFAPYLDYPTRLHKIFQPAAGVFIVMSPGTDSLAYLNKKSGIKTVSRTPFPLGEYDFHYRSRLVVINDTLLYLTAHESGFYKLSLQPASGRIDFHPTKYFPSYSCKSILKDRDQNLWIATNKGLFKQNHMLSYLQQMPVPTVVESVTPNILVEDICTTDDKIFVGARGDGGLLVFDKKTLQFIRQVKPGPGGGKASNIYAVARGDKDHLLVGTNGPLYEMRLDNYALKSIIPAQWNPETDWISDIHKDRKGNTWVMSSKIYRKAPGADSFDIITTTEKLFNRIHTASHADEDRMGNIWLAGHALCRYNTATQTFDRFIDSFPFIKMPNKQVNTWAADQQNNLWIAVYNNGLVRYNPGDNSYRHFTRDDGLPDNNIASLIAIGDKLWVASYSGIACLDLSTQKIISFGKEDGFPDMPIVQGAAFYYDSSENWLYMAFSNAVVRFDPDRILMKTPAPALFVENVRAGNRQSNYLPSTGFEASWQDNEITVTIGSINFLNNSSQRFAYRIVKKDTDGWQQLGSRNTFTISNLAPGMHRIQVKLLSLDNRWPEQVKEILVSIKPPFWKENWFTITLAALLLAGVYALVKWQAAVVRKQEQQKTNIQELKAAEYKNKFELEQISNYFSSSMADKKYVDDVLWDLTRNLIARLNYEDCMIYLWNEDKTKMIQKAAYGPKGSPEALREQVFDVAPGQGVVGYVMLTREPLLIPDTRLDARYRKDEMMRLSEICVPIIHNDELIGIIDSEHSELNYYKETDMKILTTIATLVGNKIKQIESEQSLQVKQAEIATINQQLAEAQLSALQTQMNPHFIFNALNSIKRMILDNQQQKASRYLSKFAQMIRLTLDQSKEIFATLHENIEYLERYLEMEKLRFDDSFTFQIAVSEGVDEEEAMIPTLMIQPLVENAIWHGLMHKEGEKKLYISFTRQHDTLICMIEDNGIGIHQSKKLNQGRRSEHRSMGLDNLNNRIMIMNEKYEAGCRLDITDLKEIDKTKSGTLAVLSFNIVNNKLTYESIAG